MRKNPGRLAAVALALAALASACASNSKTAAPLNSSADGATAFTYDDKDGFVLTRISEPVLENGRCGMLLWTLENDRPAAVFKFTDKRGGFLSVNGREYPLARIDVAGEQAFGVAERQRFTDEAQFFDVTVAVQIGLGFDHGAYLERGLITLVTPEGWRSVTPVAGIAGCRSS